MKETFTSAFFEFLVGNLSGWASVTIGQPLDYLKVQIQTKHKIPNPI